MDKNIVFIPIVLILTNLHKILTSSIKFNRIQTIYYFGCVINKIGDELYLVNLKSKSLKKQGNNSIKKYSLVNYNQP